jgi:hypothetical protein
MRALLEAIAARAPEGEAPCCYTPQARVAKETAL